MIQVDIDSAVYSGSVLIFVLARALDCEVS